MRDRDIRLIHLVEADLCAINKALSELSNVAIGAYNASCALQATRHKLRQELMQALFDEYAQGIDLDGWITLKPNNGRGK
jgi:hypothetical protein